MMAHWEDGNHTRSHTFSHTVAMARQRGAGVISVDQERVADSAFGALLRRHRLAAGLSQEMLAERARMSINGISALERGNRQYPYRETVVLLAKALKSVATRRSPRSLNSCERIDSSRSWVQVASARRAPRCRLPRICSTARATASGSSNSPRSLAATTSQPRPHNHSVSRWPPRAIPSRISRVRSKREICCWCSTIANISSSPPRGCSRQLFAAARRSRSSHRVVRVLESRAK
jgi:transcriptional regulator with XRE-family HTH domain